MKNAAMKIPGRFRKSSGCRRAFLLAAVLMGVGARAGYCADPDFASSPELPAVEYNYIVSSSGNAGQSGNVADLVQAGEGNYASLSQDGWGNRIRATQQGAGNWAWTHQAGVENQISLAAKGEGTSTIIGQYGIGNSTEVTHNGSGTSARVFQYGNNDQASVSMNAGPPVTVRQWGADGAVAKVIQY